MKAIYNTALNPRITQIKPIPPSHTLAVFMSFLSVVLQVEVFEPDRK